MISSLLEVAELDVRGFQERGIKKVISEFYKVRVEYDDNKNITAHYYPYGVTDIVGYKVRQIPKDFRSIGKIKGLFGQLQFNSGKRLVITEGELDAMTVAQAYYDKYGVVYPAVSISGASNTKELLEQRDWVRSFEEVILWFDGDDPGREATEKAARIIGADKVKIATCPEKDASDLYTKNKENGSKLVLSAIYDAKPWSPAGIISSANTWEKYKNSDLGEYIPWGEYAGCLNEKIYGRRLGSITMLTSGTGMGKTSFVKEDQYHLLKTTDFKIGVCSLEESIHEAVINIMALHANKRIQLPDVTMTDEEERKLWEDTMGGDRFLFLDHQGSLADDSLISKIEFMALSGCKAIYLDHVTIAVSESEGDSVNAAIDKLMSDLLKIVKRYGVWICVISHLRKTPNNSKSFEEGAVPSEDDLKGSGALKQVPMQTIAMSRNKLEKDPIKRNTSLLWILKDRFTGRSGPGGATRFVEETGRLIKVEVDEGFESVPMEE